MHNSCVCLCVCACMQTAKQLAEAVIPNEYGIDPPQKLRIGSKICNALLGKLLADLANMKDESLATAVSSSHVISLESGHVMSHLAKSLMRTQHDVNNFCYWASLLLCARGGDTPFDRPGCRSAGADCASSGLMLLGHVCPITYTCGCWVASGNLLMWCLSRVLEDVSLTLLIAQQGACADAQHGSIDRIEVLILVYLIQCRDSMPCRVMRPPQMRCRPMAWGHRACRTPVALLTSPRRLPRRAANRANPWLALATQAACTRRSQVCPTVSLIQGR